LQRRYLVATIEVGGGLRTKAENQATSSVYCPHVP